MSAPDSLCTRSHKLGKCVVFVVTTRNLSLLVVRKTGSISTAHTHTHTHPVAEDWILEQNASLSNLLSFCFWMNSLRLSSYHRCVGSCVWMCVQSLPSLSSSLFLFSLPHHHLRTSCRTQQPPSSSPSTCRFMIFTLSDSFLFVFVFIICKSSIFDF